MRLKTLFEKCRTTDGITTETTQTVKGDGEYIVDCFYTEIVDYRNQDGSVGVKPKIGVSIQHTKEEAQFVDGLRIDVRPDLALTIRTVKRVAKIFKLN